MTSPGVAWGALTWLADHAGDIIEARLKGTQRHWMQKMGLEHAKQIENDIIARAERLERTPLAIGEHPAPLHLDVFDVIVDLLATADDIAEKVAQAAGVERMPPATSVGDDPAPYLRYAAQHLTAAMEVDPQLGRYIEDETARLKYLVALKLGEFIYGQRLLALCPWCHGGAMQEYTLRVREVRGEPAVVCESGTCEPSEADCGIWHRGHPAWSLDREGAWLADRIERMQERGAA